MQAARGCPRYGHAGRLVNVIAAWIIAAAALALPLAPSPAAAAAPRILAFGDSLTAGLGVKPNEAFPARLQAALAAAGVPAEIINGGVSGDTTAGGLARLDWALSDRPAYVLVELGANDMLRGIDPKVTRANLDEILRRVIAAGAKPLLLGMKSLANWGRDYAGAFDAIYPELAAKYGVPLYPFFLDGVALDPTLNQGDGLHPNARGADLIAGRIAPYVEQLIGAKPNSATGSTG
jgi:acyl-CoA thioesterase-1